jgi:hypothetical protein
VLGFVFFGDGGDGEEKGIYTLRKEDGMNGLMGLYVHL